MNASVSVSVASAPVSYSSPSSPLPTKSFCHNNLFFHFSKSPSSTAHASASSLQLRPNNKFLLQVVNDSNQTEFPTADEEGDRIVDGMDFGELCNEFECKSSPLVEATARQLVRDILELRQGNRALGSYATTVKYKDPVRSFTGRDKYKRQLWATRALDNLKVVKFLTLDSKQRSSIFLYSGMLSFYCECIQNDVILNKKSIAANAVMCICILFLQSVQEMVMLSTSLLSIKWTLSGKAKSLIGGDLVVKIHSKFTLNQISGQVIEHEELWDLSASSFLAQAYFWASRRLFAASEAGKDLADSVKDLNKRFTADNKNVEIYPDPTGDPTKFFQRDDGFQRDAYQIALFLAVVYFVVQFLKTTL